jgi:hypothetical protein
MNRITLITLLSAAACSSSNTPTPEEYEDTAQAIGSTIATGGGGGDAASMSDSVAISLGAMPLGLAVRGDARIGGNRLGVEYTYTAVCKDAAGATLAVCNRTTDSAELDVAWSGDLETPNLSASVSRDGSLTITGLQSDTATITGDSTFSFDSELRSVFRNGVTATLSFDASASYEAIKVSTEDREVISGSATLSVSANRTVTGTQDNDVDRSFEVDATVTFNGDGSASLVLDGNERFSVNLTTGRVQRAP